MMNWLEKFHKEHPQLSPGYIVAMYCPNDKLVNMVCEETDGQPDCEKCWARPVPEETAAEDEDITVAEPVYDPAMSAGLTVDGPDRT